MTETSDRSEENVQRKIQNQDSSRSCRLAVEEEVATITPAGALALASEQYRSLVADHGSPTWPSIVEASRQAAIMLGIDQRRWEAACQKLGRERAAICLLVIDRNARLQSGHRYQAKHPGKCLNASEVQGLFAGLKLDGMAQAFEFMIGDRSTSELTIAEIVGRLCVARFRFHAQPEDIIWDAQRGFDKQALRSLLHPDWIRRVENVLLTGAFGTGKTWLACAIGNALV